MRISVTDRCNFRCQYCMPAEGLPWLQRDEILTYEEITRVVGAARLDGRARRAVDRRRAAGAPRAVAARRAAFSADENVHDLSLTTNGYLLERQVEKLVQAGLRRVNVSLDALAPDRFFQLTRRNSLQQVLEGLAAAEQYPRAAADQGQRRRAEGLHRGRGRALRRVRPQAPVRGPLHRVHAARRRPHLVARPRAAQRRGAAADPRGLSLEGARPRAPRHRRGAGSSPTARARSASSRPSRSRSAATATGSA